MSALLELNQLADCFRKVIGELEEPVLVDNIGGAVQIRLSPQPEAEVPRMLEQ